MEFNEEISRKYRAAVEQYRKTSERASENFQAVKSRGQEIREEYLQLPAAAGAGIQNWNTETAEKMSDQIGELGGIYTRQGQLLAAQSEALRALNQVLSELRELVIEGASPGEKQG